MLSSIPSPTTFSSDATSSGQLRCGERQYAIAIHEAITTNTMSAGQNHVGDPSTIPSVIFYRSRDSRNTSLELSQIHRELDRDRSERYCFVLQIFLAIPLELAAELARVAQPPNVAPKAIADLRHAYAPLDEYHELLLALSRPGIAVPDLQAFLRCHAIDRTIPRNHLHRSAPILDSFLQVDPGNYQLPLHVEYHLALVHLVAADLGIVVDWAVLPQNLLAHRILGLPAFPKKAHLPFHHFAGRRAADLRAVAQIVAGYLVAGYLVADRLAVGHLVADPPASVGKVRHPVADHWQADLVLATLFADRLFDPPVDVIHLVLDHLGFPDFADRLIRVGLQADLHLDALGRSALLVPLIACLRDYHDLLLVDHHGRDLQDPLDWIPHQLARRIPLLIALIPAQPHLLLAADPSVLVSMIPSRFR